MIASGILKAVNLEVFRVPVGSHSAEDLEEHMFCDILLLSIVILCFVVPEYQEVQKNLGSMEGQANC